MSAPRKNPLPCVLDLDGPTPEEKRLGRRGQKSLSAAAAHLSVSKSHIKKLVKDGVVTTHWFAGKRMIPKRELDDLIAAAIHESRQAEK